MDKEKQYIDEKELWEVVIKVADMEVRSGGQVRLSSIQNNLEICQTG